MHMDSGPSDTLTMTGIQPTIAEVRHGGKTVNSLIRTCMCVNAWVYNSLLSELASHAALAE